MVRGAHGEPRTCRREAQKEQGAEGATQQRGIGPQPPSSWASHPVSLLCSGGGASPGPSSLSPGPSGLKYKGD